MFLIPFKILFVSSNRQKSLFLKFSFGLSHVKIARLNHPLSPLVYQQQPIYCIRLKASHRMVFQDFFIVNGLHILVVAKPETIFLSFSPSYQYSQSFLIKVNFSCFPSLQIHYSLNLTLFLVFFLEG